MLKITTFAQIYSFSNKISPNESSIKSDLAITWWKRFYISFGCWDVIYYESTECTESHNAQDSFHLCQRLFTDNREVAHNHWETW